MITTSWKEVQAAWLQRPHKVFVKQPPQPSSPRGPEAASRASANVNFEGPDPRIRQLIREGDWRAVWDRMVSSYYRHEKGGRTL